MKMSAKMLLGLALLLPAPLAAKDQGGLPSWMSGSWIATQGDSWTEEYWTPPRAGLMLGAGRNGKGKDLLGWEATRIATDNAGKIAFVAMPLGGPATTFALESSDANTISFANPGHDYPQRVRYWREGEGLVAEISLMDGSRAKRWQYRPMWKR